MKWSYKIGSLAGIDVYVHATFFLLLLWFGLSTWTSGGNIGAVIENLLFICALFGCVVLHELGHALTGRRYGVSTRHITLLPIGGVAAMEKLPENPRHEMLVALAGPAVNIVIAAILWLWLQVEGVVFSEHQLGLLGGDFIARLLVVNLFLAVFNLIPAFPMDGGRVLRAALALRTDRASATQVAARIGQSVALVFGLLGLFYNPFLLLIALFVWLGAAAEAGSESMRSSLGSTTVGQAMLTDYHVLNQHDSLARAVQLTLASSQKDFPVLNQAGEYYAVLTQTDMLRGIHDHGDCILISELALSPIQFADHTEPVDGLLERFGNRETPLIAVTRDGEVVGIINLDNILELASIRKATHTERAM